DGGALRLSWTYPAGAFAGEEVERVAAAALDALRGLIAHCREVGAGAYTPSDFPLAALSAEELETVAAGRAGVEDVYPLSPMQEGMLFHVLYGGGKQAYQIHTVERLEGDLDPALFRAAWDRVVARHATLRTSFAWEGLRRPLQRVESAVEVPWTVEDWRGHPSDHQKAALARFLDTDGARGFDLHRAPLMRGALFRVEDGAWWFVWRVHHLLMDGPSLVRVSDEAFRTYEALSAGDGGEPAPERPYRDFIAWLQRQDQGAAERYWRQVLGDFSAPTPLGIGRPGVLAGAKQARRDLVLSAALTRRLDELARRRQVTVSTVLLGAWGLLLSRYGGEDDVVFGTTVSGRPAGLAGAGEMVGLFINTLPVRIRVRGDLPAGAWLGEVQREQARARDYDFASLAQVQGWSAVPRGTPLFQSLVVFENYPRDPERGDPGARLRRADGHADEWTNYPITLVAHPRDEMVLGLSYDESRFDGRTMERMLRHLERVLEQLAGDAERPLSALSLVDESERTLVVEEWNRTTFHDPSDKCVHRIFEAYAAGAPDARAVMAGGRTLTYRELDERANRLANHLAALGVGPEVRVGVCLERSTDLVTAVLAVMKAGGAFVPLDPDYPAERLAYMLADSGAPVLVTRESLSDVVPALGGVKTVRVDADADAIAARDARAPRPTLVGENAAYVIYTSGSTGRPKAVLAQHGSLANLLAHTRRALGVGPDDVGSALASFAFDIWLLETLLPL
ncbi:MAG TPA: condensation domain-containing protein, partial [Longimicrobiaceae bacterium]